jgi:hypothetical protein
VAIDARCWIVLVVVVVVVIGVLVELELKVSVVKYGQRCPHLSGLLLRVGVKLEAKDASCRCIELL